MYVGVGVEIYVSENEKYTFLASLEGSKWDDA